MPAQTPTHESVVRKVREPAICLALPIAHCPVQSAPEAGESGNGEVSPQCLHRLNRGTRVSVNREGLEFGERGETERGWDFGRRGAVEEER